MPGYLPDPPQVPVAGMGPHPTPQMNNSPAWQNPQAIAQGIASFAQNYMLASRQKEQDAAKKVQDTIQLAMLGIPIDDKQLVKNIKASKLPIALDPDSARTFTAPQAPNTPQSSVAPPPDPQQLMLAQGSGTNPLAALPPGVVSQPTAPGAMGPQNPATAMAPIGPPSNLNIPQTVGPNPQSMNPQVAAAAVRPGPDYMQQQPVPKTLSGFLSSLQQQGWDEKQMRSSMQNILRGALQGDNRALEMATRLGLTKTIGAHDELFLLADKLYPDKSPMEAQAAVGKMLLYDMMGGPQMEAKKMEVAKGMLPYFNNNLDQARQYTEEVYSGKQPTIKPQMSFDQFKDIMDMQGKIQAQFPTSGNLPTVAATMMMAGKTQDAMQLISGIAQHFPNQSSLNMQMKEREFNWDKEKFSQAQKLDYARMAQAKQQFDQQYALNTLQFYEQKARGEFNQWWDIMKDPKSSAASKDTAVRGLADALEKQGVDVQVDQVRRWYAPFIKDNQITIKDRGKDSVGTTMGEMKPMKNPFGEEDPNYWSQLSSYLSKLPGFSYDFFKRIVTGDEEK